jgi:hypothetical protein
METFNRLFKLRNTQKQFVLLIGDAYRLIKEVGILTIWHLHVVWVCKVIIVFIGRLVDKVCEALGVIVEHFFIIVLVSVEHSKVLESGGCRVDSFVAG